MAEDFCFERVFFFILSSFCEGVLDRLSFPMIETMAFSSPLSSPYLWPAKHHALEAVLVLGDFSHR